MEPHFTSCRLGGLRDSWAHSKSSNTTTDPTTVYSAGANLICSTTNALSALPYTTIWRIPNSLSQWITTIAHIYQPTLIVPLKHSPIPVPYYCSSGSSSIVSSKCCIPLVCAEHTIYLVGGSQDFSHWIAFCSTIVQLTLCILRWQNGISVQPCPLTLSIVFCVETL